MSCTALIVGKLIADPEQRVGTAGKAFTTARMAAAGTGDESVIASVIAFGHIGEQLGALCKGDAVAIVGRIKPTAWTTKDGMLRAGLDVVADQLLTTFHARRKRAAMACDGAPRPASTRDPLSAGAGPDGLDDGADDPWLTPST